MVLVAAWVAVVVLAVAVAAVTKTMMMRMMGMVLVVVMLGPALEICFEDRAQGKVGCL